MKRSHFISQRNYLEVSNLKGKYKVSYSLRRYELISTVMSTFNKQEQNFKTITFNTFHMINSANFYQNMKSLNEFYLEILIQKSLKMFKTCLSF